MESHMPFSPVREIYKGKTKKISPATKKRLLKGVNLDFKGKPTQHATHALHPYVAAINPPLSRKLIDTYVPLGESVLDPFCGGGGVLVESILSERKCAGFDINPLGAMISSAKTSWIDYRKIKCEYRRIKSRMRTGNSKVEPDISDAAKYWFKEESLPRLSTLSNAVKKCKDEDLKNLFKVILSATVRSTMLTYRGEVRLRKLRGKDLQKFHPDPFDIFEKRYNTALEQISSLPMGCSSGVSTEDIRRLPLEDNEYHSIICSPPYADDTNGVGYFQFSRYMLEWLGMTPEAINKYKKLFLGSEKKGKDVPQSETLHESISHVKENSKKHYKEAIAFYADYYQALLEMNRVVSDWIIIVIGNRVLARTLFDNANITIELFKSIGIPLIDYYSRINNKKRIPNLGGDGGGTNVEHILIFKKS